MEKEKEDTKAKRDLKMDEQPSKIKNFKGENLNIKGFRYEAQKALKKAKAQEKFNGKKIKVLNTDGTLKGYL